MKKDGSNIQIEDAFLKPLTEVVTLPDTPNELEFANLELTGGRIQEGARLVQPLFLTIHKTGGREQRKNAVRRPTRYIGLSHAWVVLVGVRQSVLNP